MVFFYCIYGLIDFAVIFLAIVQSLYVLITGEPQQDLQRFGAALGQYLKDIVSYLSWNREQKPFPFEDWPASRDREDI